MVIFCAGSVILFEEAGVEKERSAYCFTISTTTMATFTASCLALQGPTSVTNITSSSQEIFGESLFQPARLSLCHKTRATRHGVHYIAPKIVHPGQVQANLSTTLKGLFEHEGTESVKPTLTFYVHETRAGKDPTARLVAGPGAGTFNLQFGSICVFKNDVKEGAAIDSKQIGNERGLGSVTDIMESGLQLTSTISFNKDSTYNGSSLIFTGAVGIPTVTCEVVILGGTGHFRGARGHALVKQLQTAKDDPTRAAFQWDVFITK